MSVSTRLCLQPWNTINVGADGKVYPCCVTTDELVIGYLSEMSIEEILAGQRMHTIRNQLLMGTLKDPCAGCHNAELTTVDAFHSSLNDYLASASVELGMHNRLIMIESSDCQFQSVGNVKTSKIQVPDVEEEIEVHSGFSHTSYLQGHIDLSTDFTIGLWLKGGTSQQSSILLHYAAFEDGAWSGPVIELSLGPSPSNNLVSVISSNGYADATGISTNASVYSDSKWTHIALSKIGACATLFLNGKVVATKPTFPGSIYNPSAIARIGVNCAPNRGSSFSGSIGGIFIENKPLSSAELWDVFQAERYAFESATP
jgi:radical SAM protein with 4Fe4S-binding SPASM domain